MLLPLAHVTPTDVGFGIGLFVLGVVVGVALAGRVRDSLRRR